jgi:hypothetical protein
MAFALLKLEWGERLHPFLYTQMGLRENASPLGYGNMGVREILSPQ